MSCGRLPAGFVQNGGALGPPQEVTVSTRLGNANLLPDDVNHALTVCVDQHSVA